MSKLKSSTTRFLYTQVHEVDPVVTSHQIGSKRVLCKGFPESVQLKQIAVGGLGAGEHVATHVHPDMDEYYHILSGAGFIYIDEVRYDLWPGIFLIVPAGSAHSLHCEDVPLEFFYFGLEILL